MIDAPAGWPSSTLGEALEVLIDHRGKTPAKLGGTFEDTGVPAISAMNIKDGRIDWNRRPRYVSPEMYERWMRVPLRAGDVLMTSEAPLGELAVVPNDDPLVLSQRLFAFRGRSSLLDNRFLRWFFESPQGRDQLFARSSGSTVTGIRQAELRQVVVPLPPLREQRRMVEIVEDHLSRLDAGSSELDAVAQRTKLLLTAGLWAATHNLPTSQSVRLDEISSVRLGRQRSPKNHSGDRMRPYLRAANVDWDRLRLDDILEMNFTEAEELTYRLRVGDILLTEASGSPREVGKSVLYTGTPNDVCFQNTLLRVRAHGADPEFLQKYLLAEAHAGRFMPEARGVGINHLGRAKLAALKVELPTPEEQAASVAECRRLADRVEALNAAVEIAQKRASNLRRALIAAAFSGQLTGHRTADEVIEELAGAGA